MSKPQIEITIKPSEVQVHVISIIMAPKSEEKKTSWSKENVVAEKNLPYVYALPQRLSISIFVYSMRVFDRSRIQPTLGHNKL